MIQRTLAQENALGSLRMCGRCHCCSLEEQRRYFARSGPRQWDSVVIYGECVGKCSVDRHTEESVDAARAKLYAEQEPLRSAARHDRDDALAAYDRAIADLDAEYRAL